MMVQFRLINCVKDRKNAFKWPKVLQFEIHEPDYGSGYESAVIGLSDMANAPALTQPYPRPVVYSASYIGVL